MSLEIWNKVRSVPDEAKKTIGGGRLKGMTDINPVWRLKVLTEVYGVCGIGWKYEVTHKEMVNGANDEIAAFVDVNLYVSTSDGWSDAIPGTGGSMFVEKERTGLHTNDEAYKMALTDALSVACKALGVAADVYWSKDRTKYESTPEPVKQSPKDVITPEQYRELGALCMTHDGKLDPKMADHLTEAYKSCGFETAKEITQDRFEKIKKAVEEKLLPFEV